MLDSRPRTSAGCQRSVRAYAIAAESSSAMPEATTTLTSPASPCSVTVTVRMTRTIRATAMPASATNSSGEARIASFSLGGRNSLVSRVSTSANSMTGRSNEPGSASAMGDSSSGTAIETGGSTSGDCSASKKVAVISNDAGACATLCIAGKTNSAITAKCSATTAIPANPRLKVRVTPRAARCSGSSGGRHSSTSRVPRWAFTAGILVHKFPQIKRENRQNTGRS